MSYEAAMEAAGAKIIAFEQFGSYQGDWWALVEYDGERGWVSGSYGSCSGCDSFEAEFDYSRGEECEEHRYSNGDKVNCAACADAKTDYERRLADFGRQYLDDLLTQEQAEKDASENLEWDSEAPEMLAFIKSNAGNYRGES